MVFHIGDVVFSVGHEWDVTNIADGMVYMVGPVFYSFPVGELPDEFGGVLWTH